MARGTYIATYHADDLYEPTIVERQVESFQRFPGVGAVFCLDVLVDAENREYGRMVLPPELPGSSPLAFPAILNALLSHKNRFLVCPSAMTTAAVHRQVGLYRQDQWKNSSDLDMWIRIARVAPIVVLEEYLMRYRHTEQQSSRRYHRQRVEPERFFSIMDWHLARGGRPVASVAALRDYEAHRTEDWLLVAVRRYVAGDRLAAGEALSHVSVAALLRSQRVQRGRLALLAGLMRCMTALPWMSAVAGLLYSRWQGPRTPGRRRGLRQLRDGLREWRNRPAEPPSTDAG
jgi:hypothetical protein